MGMGAGRGRGPRSSRPPAERNPERRPVKFPRPRYQTVIIMNPQHFNWLPVPGVDGVERKLLGTFTERQFWIEFIKIDAGAEWVSKTDAGRQLMVALSGTATALGTEIGKLAALQVEPGEELRVSATEETVLYNVGLPPVQLPRVPSDQFDIVTSDGAIEFEKARERV
jgi:hypothetical protein